MGNRLADLREYCRERKREPIRYSKLKDILTPFVHSLATYKKVRNLLTAEMDKGLSRAKNKDATVKMFITYVRSLPDGSETGKFLALDLGGTNFRVLVAELKGENIEMKHRIYPIGEGLMTGPGTELFDYIASCIENFVEENQLSPSSADDDAGPLPLGFTFSFPCRQEGLAIGRLVVWTKGFSCPGVAGQNVAQLLQNAIQRRNGLKVECVAVLNDTVGCLMSCAFHDHNASCGVIFGTGTNACYMEKLEKVELWDGDKSGPQQVIINTEWGAFGDNGCLDFIRTAIDKETDSKSLNPGRQIFEKMISGMYMGEIMRCVIAKCADQKLLFRGILSPEFQTHNRFYTKYISEIEEDSVGEYTNTKQVLEEMGTTDASTDDLKYVRYIAQIISERSAYLAAAGLASLLNRIDQPRTTVAVDGSLYRYHPYFAKLVKTMVLELTNQGHEVRLMISEDGSGKGAALVAAVAQRLKKQKHQ